MNSDVAIRDVVHGDSFAVVREVCSIPDGETVLTGWLALKRYKDDEDPTVRLVAASITNNSPDDGSGIVEFDMTPADWENILPETLYFYDIKIQTTGGAIYTFETGTLMALLSIGDAS